MGVFCPLRSGKIGGWAPPYISPIPPIYTPHCPCAIIMAYRRDADCSRMYGEGPIQTRYNSGAAVCLRMAHVAGDPCGRAPALARSPNTPRKPPERGQCARLRRADFARSARRFLGLYAPIVRPAGAQYARLRREWVRKTPAGSARVFRGGRVDLSGGLQNHLQTPPKCPQISL